MAMSFGRSLPIRLKGIAAWFEIDKFWKEYLP